MLGTAQSKAPVRRPTWQTRPAAYLHHNVVHARRLRAGVEGNAHAQAGHADGEERQHGRCAAHDAARSEPGRHRAQRCQVISCTNCPTALRNEG